MLDLEPATLELSAIVAGVRDEQLVAPTPCARTSVADLLDHVDGLAVGFGAAAAKQSPPGGGAVPTADGSRLVPQWRARIPERLAAMAAAWREDGAWTGRTTIGGVDLPGEVTGIVGLNELVVHAWDIAVATGQDYTCAPELALAAPAFAESSARANPNGSPGLFGPPVAVPDDAPPLDRLLALTGRDPRWRPARSAG